MTTESTETIVANLRAQATRRRESEFAAMERRTRRAIERHDDPAARAAAIVRARGLGYFGDIDEGTRRLIDAGIVDAAELDAARGRRARRLARIHARRVRAAAEADAAARANEPDPFAEMLAAARNA